MPSLEYFYEMEPQQSNSTPPMGEHAPLRDVFRAHGLRCTRQREQVYRALAASRSHPTAEELHGIVKDSDGGLSLATVYNTLEAFTERGLCRRLPSATGPVRFDADTSRHAHIVLDDGQVMDLPDDLSDRLAVSVPDDLRAEIESRLGVRVGEVSVHITGEKC